MSKDVFDDVEIVARALQGQERLSVLPELFDRHMMRFEALVYGWAGRLAANYGGGHWEMYRLSNGGFYMAPSSNNTYQVTVDGNLFSGELTADAMGIVVTLFALNQLAWDLQSADVSELYHHLRDYAAGHSEAVLIYRAID